MAPFNLTNRARTLFALVLGLSNPALADDHLVFSDVIDLRPGSVIAQRVLTDAYKRIGVSVRFEQLPNSRAKSLIEAGELDGAAYRIIDSPVGDLQKIAPPITYEEFGVFSVDKQFTVAGYESLRPYSIGYLAGAKLLEVKLRGMRVDTAPNMESLFRKLEAGRTDLVVDSRASYCELKGWGLHRVVLLEPSLEKFLGYHWISKRHEALIPKLEAVLRKMSQDGTLRNIQEAALKDFQAQCAH
ncbi:transporter substrate-binding domain-containing protein [Undibacterium sp.]|jgi:polar amino acid transport system substrate-binding protein|uniref:substrate-binding periplasmic protein n=1 Tax=Undibacterium sp. TaxID=1914977 RepID=UPI002C2B1886|nr:transporter substrate-binding domain-containing protein [Undibacterium sp.]HTD05889.1 transporter substrate-binding domain-containing protein [Undibacterium sp.]